MPRPWPWVKVMERSSSTIPQTHIFFVPNIKGLPQIVLTWEGKVFAAPDGDTAAAVAAAAETDWKHKVTPERGDLMIHDIVNGLTNTYDRIILMVGGNDCNSHNNASRPVSDILEDYRLLIQDTKSKSHTVQVVSNVFNQYFSTVGTDDYLTESKNIGSIVDSYKNHQSIVLIRSRLPETSSFAFQETNQNEVLNLLKNLDPKKASRYDCFPPKILR